MNINNDQKDKTTCDACRRETAENEIKFMLLKTCCSVQRIPLCRECYDRYAQKRKQEVRDERN